MPCPPSLMFVGKARVEWRVETVREWRQIERERVSEREWRVERGEWSVEILEWRP
jgi:hypothetical protein